MVGSKYMKTMQVWRTYSWMLSW